MKSILIISNFLPTTAGSYGVCMALANRLRMNGWKVITTSSQPVRFLRLLDMLATIIKRRRGYCVAQVDVFSGPAFIWAELCCLLLVLLRKPFVLTLHGGNLPNFADQRPARVKRLLRQAAVVTAPSEYLRTAFKEYCLDLVLLPNPLDLQCYPFQARENPQPRLIWLRAFHQIYHPELAVKALHLLRKEFPNMHLTMIGPDKGDGSYQNTTRLAEELGVKEQIEFVKGVSKQDVPAWLSKADIFINTTNVDNTPVSVMEAMACGLCVVSTNVGGLPYLVTDEQDGILVPPEDPGLMAAAVRRLLESPCLASRISINGRKKAEQFDWPVILPSWEKILGSLISSFPINT